MDADANGGHSQSNSFPASGSHSQEKLFPHSQNNCLPANGQPVAEKPFPCKRQPIAEKLYHDGCGCQCERRPFAKQQFPCEWQPLAEKPKPVSQRTATVRGEPVNRFRKPDFLTARFPRGGRGKDDLKLHTFASARRVDVNFFLNFKFEF